MWNDEDNNPYGSFDRRDSSNSASGVAGSPPSRTSSYSYHGYQQHGLVGAEDENGDAPYDRPATPTSTNSSDNHDVNYHSRGRGPNEHGQAGPEDHENSEVSRKRGAYDSRVEQILYEQSELPIVITDAGKNVDGGGNHIVYTIRTGDIEVRRRYSEFATLRETLVNLHPTLVIPPIPEKHSMTDYAAKPTKAKEDMRIIDLRKRMLSVFLNRCRRMKEIREDGVWWRFLDPKTSWSEVLNSHPVSSIPKSIMKAPPLDPANPTQAHSWLPVPSTNAKLKSGPTSSTGMPSSAPESATSATSIAHTIPGLQVFGRFPPSSKNLSEPELDPYFINFETATKELEILLQGNIEKVNRRTLSHLSSLAADLAELGARYNAFSLSEQSPTLAAAIERVGQAVDSSYIATEELSSSLGASFAEPMRESSQFAGVVRNVLRYRVLKRIQEDMTKDELRKKKELLASLEASEMEANRMEQYLNSTSGPNVPRRSLSTSSSGTARETPGEDNASIDSDFPPTQGDGPSSPSAPQGTPKGQENGPASTTSPTKRASGNFVTNKIFGRLSHAVHGIVDVDPERTRRDQIGKTKESLVQLEQALTVSDKDVKDASAGVLKDLKRFQKEKEDDFKRYMIAYAKCHIEWAKKNLETWEEARGEVNKIEVH